MNAQKSEKFLKLWEKDKDSLRRRLTQFSLQLTPTKFCDMIDYKKLLLENLEPQDIDMQILSTGKEIYQNITDSKMKSLCLKKAKPLIEKLEAKANDIDLKPVAKQSLVAFLDKIELKTFVYGTKMFIKENFDVKKLIINDITLEGITTTKGLSFDVITFNEGFSSTFVARLELLNGDMYSIYSSISRDGQKGEKPKVFASAFVNGYYISSETEYNNIY